MLSAMLALGVLSALFGLLLGYAAIRFKVEGDPIVEQIDALLPQTQCGQCGYAGCRPYAEAIAGGEADINQCPPGGDSGIQALAELLGVDPKPLNAEHGETTEDRLFSLETVNCLGTCALAPVVMVEDDYYDEVQPGRVEKILSNYRSDSEG